MIELGREKRHVIDSLCEDRKEVLIRSAVEGKMGRVWIPTFEKPSYCVAKVGDFAYLIGLPPKGIKGLELRELLTENCFDNFITPTDERWVTWLNEEFAGGYRQITRYALKKEDNNFDSEKLKEYASRLPEGVKIKRIDEKIYHMTFKEDWSMDFCSNFDSAEHFLADGMGYVAMKGKELISGCSSYGSSQGMMEIQMQTKPEYRRQGLALACSAAFLLECLNRGIYPEWDAANTHSVSVAENLGYIFDKEYLVYQLLDKEDY